MKQHLVLASKYALFAAIAIIVNLGSQELSIRALTHVDIGTSAINLWVFFAGPWNMLVGMFVGTGTGLVVKYLLDKKYIFIYETQDLKQDGKAFVLYSMMGLVTTAIFYGMQLGFFKLFGTRIMFYTGGALGLIIGYWVKYELDKRFVFVK